MARHFSNEPDANSLAIARPLAAAGLLMAGGTALAVLLLWFIPPLDALVPAIWSKMTANTATGVVLSALFLTCGLRQCPPWQRKAVTIAAVIVLMLGLATLTEYATHISLGLDQLLPNNPRCTYPGRSSPQTALGFTLLGISMLTLRQAKNGWSMISDISALLFSALLLVMLGGYVYGDLDLVGFGASTLMAPHTLFALICLSTTLVLLRAEQGDLFAVLVNHGIGSRIVRVILPGAVFVPFLFLTSETYLRETGVVSAPYIEAIASASGSVMIICIVTWMGRRINALERELRDQSLTDELTMVYNRRGFYFLGQQAVREAERAHNGLTVFFFDLDGLKRVNDMHGHETGSAMIKVFAGILNTTFRKSDIIGRVGGDEFAVITFRDGHAWLESIYARLDQLAEAHNTTNGEIYRLSYSIGHAELRPGKFESLEDIITRADTMMYADKARKKLAA